MGLAQLREAKVIGATAKEIVAEHRADTTDPLIPSRAFVQISED